MTLLPGVVNFGELNAVLLDTYAWRVVNEGYDELMNCPALRGEDLKMPGAKGVRPFPRVIAATTVSIPLLITGGFDQDGAPITKPGVGRMQHRDYLRANLGLAEDGDPDDGTVPFVFYREDLPNWSGDVTFLGFFGWTNLGEGDAMVRLDLSIPDGELAETGS